ncbi:hypothetical protein Taro_017321 [Colocasia esculenta]|uniref:Uncharacterized protein n=1 Tax=Colocasia esculenta TaxID=4460 RepID=A0A843USY1_COLES|nr:hypothetical protein [Colocasia esculenta]
MDAFIRWLCAVLQRRLSRELGAFQKVLILIMGPWQEARDLSRIDLRNNSDGYGGQSQSKRTVRVMVVTCGN